MTWTLIRYLHLLAEQHLTVLRGWLEPLGIRVAWLAGKVTGRARRDVLAAVASGEAQVVVGTHALMQDAVAFECCKQKRKQRPVQVVGDDHAVGSTSVVLTEAILAEGLKYVTSGAANPVTITTTPVMRRPSPTAHTGVPVAAVTVSRPFQAASAMAARAVT